MKRKASYNTDVRKRKMKRMQAIFNELYRDSTIVGITCDYIQLTRKAFKDMAVPATIKFITPNEPDGHLMAYTSNNIQIVTIMNANETIEDYIGGKPNA